MWKISEISSFFVDTYRAHTRTLFACLWVCVCVYATNIITYFIASYEVDAKHLCRIAAAQWCQAYTTFV